MSSDLFRAGFLGLIGQPNAGKSSLLNFLMEEKVSIVTAKPQTTRRRVHGLWNCPEGQIVFVDAPGVVQAEKGLNGFLAQEAQDVIRQSDALLALVSLDEKSPEEAKKVLQMVSESQKPWMAIVTKTDLQDKLHRSVILQQMVDLVVEASPNKKFFMGTKTISIKDTDKDTRSALLKTFLQMLPLSPAPLYDTEWLTLANTKDVVAEMVREKCFEFLHQEVPYSLAVRILKYDESSKKIPHIYCEIIVSRESHKGIVIGQQGQILKKIGEEARTEIEKFLQEKVYLGLQVTYSKDWFENTRVMKELGYVTNNS
ncbi:MAG: GTPase Era [Pseudobdellovibrionaceae bacterium]